MDPAGASSRWCWRRWCRWAFEEAGSVLNNEDMLDRDKLVGKIVAQGKSDDLRPGSGFGSYLTDEHAAVDGQTLRAAIRRRRLRSRHFSTSCATDHPTDFYRAEDWAKTAAAGRGQNAQGGTASWPTTSWRGSTAWRWKPRIPTSGADSRPSRCNSLTFTGSWACRCRFRPSSSIRRSTSWSWPRWACCWAWPACSWP